MRILLVHRKLSVLERCPYGEVQLYPAGILPEKLGRGVWPASQNPYPKKGKVCIRAKWPIRPELIPVSVA